MVTRKTDYSIRILRTLSEGTQFTVREICERELLPQQFAYKLLKKLERAGWVRISRGAEGGCLLTADLTKCSLYDLMMIMEEDGCVASCTDPHFQCQWRQQKQLPCTVHRHLCQIQQTLDRELKSHSLAQILFDEN